MATWYEFPFALDDLPWCSPWNRILADRSAIGLAVDQALQCAAGDPEDLDRSMGSRHLWAAYAVLDDLLPYAEVHPEASEVLRLQAEIRTSSLILAESSERALYHVLPTIRVGRSQRIGDLWDIPAIIEAWEGMPLPAELIRQECKALDEAQDLRVSDFVRRPADLGVARWSVMALVTGDTQGYGAWQALRLWRTEQQLTGK
ncbi:hypothetical protein ABZ897_55365 [Nonomuraea sp. NPDC046802]|uniref:hypothetical protein n=1 Tax=Nonomuraea sp. NPDC046802 TaxID=3154919 RepID=UPI00340AB289